jgi:hypothetical protein
MPTVIALPDNTARAMTPTTFLAQASAGANINPDNLMHHLAVNQNRQFFESFGDSPPAPAAASSTTTTSTTTTTTTTTVD